MYKVDIGAKIPYTPEQLRGKLEKLQSFAAAHPQLFPNDVANKEFLKRIQENDRRKTEANKKGERISTKRQVEQPHSEIKIDTPTVEFFNPKIFVEIV